MTDLLDGIDLSELRGRKEKRLSAAVIRPIQEADLAVLASAEKGTAPRTIARLRDRHHAIARLVANGGTNGYISLVTGMDPARISVLRSDPMFKELVEDYRKIDAGLQADFMERATTLSLTAMEELQEAMEDPETAVPLQSLLEIAKFGADRIGYGPQSKTTALNVNVDLGGRLDRARKRLSEVDVRAIAPSVDVRATVPEPVPAIEGTSRLVTADERAEGGGIPGPRPAEDES